MVYDVTIAGKPAVKLELYRDKTGGEVLALAAFEPEGAQGKGRIEFVAVSKDYGSAKAVDAIDLRVPAATYCCLLGPSGCGKTTSLRMLAGHEIATEGDILLEPTT